MLDKDVHITRQTEQTEYGADLKRTVYLRVEFTVGDHGPFTERIPMSGLTAEIRDQRLNERAAALRTTSTPY